MTGILDSPSTHYPVDDPWHPAFPIYKRLLRDRDEMPFPDTLLDRLMRELREGIVNILRR